MLRAGAEDEQDVEGAIAGEVILQSRNWESRKQRAEVRDQTSAVKAEIGKVESRRTRR
jgi:hypothetical protein